MSDEAPASAEPVGSPAPQVKAPEAPIDLLNVNPGGSPDPNVTAPISAEPAPATPQPGGITISSDGTFSEGWHEQIADGLYKDNATLSNFKTLPGLAKTVVEQQSMIGADKVVKPGKNASQSDWEAYYKAGGHPDSVDGYKIEAQQLEDDSGYNYDKEKELLKFAHDNFFNNSQTEALINSNRQKFAESKTAELERHNENVVKAKQTLMDKWGAEFDTKVTMANEMMSDPRVEQLVTKLEAKNDPAMVELLYELRLNTREDTLPDSTVGDTQIGLQQQLQDLMAEKARLIKSNAFEDEARMDQITAQELRLRNQLTGSKGREGYTATTSLFQ